MSIEIQKCDQSTISLTIGITKREHWYVAACNEVPEANGQGKSKCSAVTNLLDAIRLILFENPRHKVLEAQEESQSDWKENLFSTSSTNTGECKKQSITLPNGVSINI